MNLVATGSREEYSTWRVRETWAVWQAGLLVVAAAWMFGGRIWWAKPILLCLVAAAPALTVWEYGARRHPPRSTKPFVALIPMAGLMALVLLSAAVPNLDRRAFGDETVWTVRPLARFWPSSADPGLTLKELALLTGCYLVGFNLWICVRSRRRLRGLFALLVANAGVLAAMGTLQKLTGRGLYFGWQQAPSPAFFATFVYHNHWGAFLLLMTGLCLGLTFYHARRAAHTRSFWTSSVPLGLVTLAILAATAPLSTSRSSTVLLGVLLVAALAHGGWRMLRHGREERRPVLARLTLAFGVALLAGVAIFKLSEGTVAARLATTRQQWQEIRARGDFGQRSVLYTDTWRMAAARPWFGWGLESYQRMFPLFNSTPRSPVDRLPIAYQEAHSDWLQSLAEIGFVGTALLAAAVLAPAWRQLRRATQSAAALYSLVGCALLAAYAWVEFPLASPAVVAAWWVVYFGAWRYAALTETR